MTSITDTDAGSTVLRELWDTTRMRLLVELERAGTLTGAAHAIGIGQPSASQHLRLLEAAAGERLVVREGRGSRLTEAGRVLAAHAAAALQALAAGEDELRALSGLHTGTIRLGASTTPGVYLLPDTLGCFRRDFPNVSVDVEIASSDEILARLLAGRVQLALVGAGEVDARIALDPFADDEIVGVARPGLLALVDGRIGAPELAGAMLLVREPGSSSRSLVEAELAAAGARFAGRWELGSSEAIKRAAREGLGVAFASAFAVADEVARGELESFRLAGREPLRRRISVARLSARPLAPSERAFVDTLRSCCAKSAEYAQACVRAVA
jgi:molybdate transport repressor ModE-like protein